jgi:ribosome biogenesis GTPase / thiamine phosphate phosphatase
MSSKPDGGAPDPMVGRVLRVDRGAVTADTVGGVVRASFALGLLGRSGEDLPAVGDWVELGAPEDDTDASVVSVLPRRTALVRASARSGGGQVVAANVDDVWIVHAFGREPNPRRIEREIALACDGDVQPTVVLNKADVAHDPATRERLAERLVGVDVVTASCMTGAGLDELRARARDRTTLLLGPSGVGKSSIANRLLGRDVLATAAVRERDQKGRHTTTARELLALADGGFLVDTPGLRAVGLRLGAGGVEHAFPEISAAAGRCRFRDCRHEREPDCAVLAAVAGGAISRERLTSYRELRDEVDG